MIASLHAEMPTLREHVAIDGSDLLVRCAGDERAPAAPGRPAALAMAIAGVVAVGAVAVVVPPGGAPSIRFPLTRVAAIRLPGPSSRFD